MSSGTPFTSSAGDGPPAGSFQGPLFLVGRPRSGTKLLRTLLNENPRIAIPEAETNFLPGFVTEFGDPPRLDDPARLEDFYARFSRTVFFDWRRRFNEVLSKEQLAATADLNSWPSIYGAILRFYAPKDLEPGVIWGDKSPKNLTWIEQLGAMFPQGRFVHIIRDPRDVCLSARTAWGKSLYRSAAAWQSEVAAARRAGSSLGSRYMEVLFEDLLAEPAEVLSGICDFVEIGYSDEMLTLSSSYEELGQAAGALGVVGRNQGRYAHDLRSRTTRRIEEIAFPAMTAVGYEPDFATSHRPLRPLARRLLRLYDGAAMAIHYGRVKGWRSGMSFVKGQVRQLLGGPRSDGTDR